MLSFHLLKLTFKKLENWQNKFSDRGDTVNKKDDKHVADMRISWIINCISSRATKQSMLSKKNQRNKKRKCEKIFTLFCFNVVYE